MSNKIGDLSIIKKHFGTLEITKEVLNGSVIYEATPPTPTYPSKSDIITMNLDGTNKQYRVLKKVSGTTYLVVSLFSIGNNSALDSNNTSTYFGKTLDTYLNTTWYGSLTSTAKSAIVSKYITIYQYNQLNSLPSNRSSWANTTASQTVASNTRYVYALGNADIEEYFNGVYTGSDLSNAFSLSTLENVWLRDRKDSYYAWSMSNSINNGIIANDRGYVSKRVNASFQIDLSKISFTKN